MSKIIAFGDVTTKAVMGDTVKLQRQSQEVVACAKTGVMMLNIDANELAKGDLAFIKRLGLTISNPDTDKPIALGVDYEEDSWGHKIKRFLDSSDEDDDDDSSFFGGLAGGFLGGSSVWGGGGLSSGGGFGGFGGGSFGGAGAGRSF
ncbi:MAG: hypothetical protein HYR95_02370 [Candidatus Colwellbacteria bacterium]|nr:hypothetical protein [Candidatus Colwellbacteria bacterium]